RNPTPAQLAAGLGIPGRVWPSGHLLARGLAEGWPGLPAVRGRRVAELGAGPGVPSLVCGLLGAAQVIATDTEDVVELLSRNVALNGLGSVCSAVCLDWWQCGGVEPWADPGELPGLSRGGLTRNP
ncbi:unnamed protein product, partial [Prorocentrum cordatum]